MMDIYTFQKSVRIRMYELRTNIIFQKKKRREGVVEYSVSVFKTLIQRGETQKHMLFNNFLKKYIYTGTYF